MNPTQQMDTPHPAQSTNRATPWATRLARLLTNPGRAWGTAAKAVAGQATAVSARFRHVRCAANVLMFHIGRSGSTVLGDLLDQHAGIYWDGELLERVLADRERRGMPLSPDDPSDRAPLQYFRRRMLRAGTRYFGAEIKPHHLCLLKIPLEEFIHSVSLLAPVRAIVLERKNYLRKIVSSLVAHQKGVFHVGPAAKPRLERIRVELANVAIDRDHQPLLALLHKYESSFSELHAVLENVPTLWISYEEVLATDPRLGYERVCEFLDLEQTRQATIRYGRTNPYPLSEMITNFNDVERELRGTRFEWMLELPEEAKHQTHNS